MFLQNALEIEHDFFFIIGIFLIIKFPILYVKGVKPAFICIETLLQIENPNRYLFPKRNTKFPKNAVSYLEEISSKIKYIPSFLHSYI